MKPPQAPDQRRAQLRRGARSHPLSTPKGCSVRCVLHTHCVSLNPHNDPKRQVPLLAPFYWGGNQGTERLSGFPKVTQPIWAEQALRPPLLTVKSILVTTKLDPRHSLGKVEAGGRLWGNLSRGDLWTLRVQMGAALIASATT